MRKRKSASATQAGFSCPSSSIVAATRACLPSATFSTSSIRNRPRIRAPEGTGGLRPVKSPLTPREWEVIDLLAESNTTDQIAELLVLSSETVRSHVKNILRKLDARSREEAVAIAQRMRSEPPA